MKILIVIMFSFLSLSIQAQDMQKYLKDTKELVRQKKYKEALQRDIWFHDHALEHDPGIRAIRLSLALDDWGKLGEVYPPAMAALKATRDRKTQQFVNNDGPADLFVDVTAINRVLKDDANTISLFQLIGKSNPYAAQVYFRYVKDQLFTAKRYDLVREYMGSPSGEFENIKARYYRDMALVKLREMTTPTVTKAVQDIFVKHVIQLIQYLMAGNDLIVARQIQQEALLVVNDDKIKQAMR